MSNSTFTKDFMDLSNYLRGFAMKLTNDNSRAQDLFQETALKAFRNQDRFQKDTNMKAWLCRIMKNSFINQYRDKKRKKKLKEKSDDLFFIKRYETGIDNQGESNIETKEILQMIEDLEDMYKIPFLMVYQGYNYLEIQDALGNLPLGTVKSRIHQARKILKYKINTKNNYQTKQLV